MGILGKFLAALIGCVAMLPAHAQVVARDGVIDLRGRDLARDIPAVLSGEWAFAWQRFEDPAKPATGTGRIPVPGPWNAASGSGEGYATYRLTILCDGTDL